MISPAKLYRTEARVVSHCSPKTWFTSKATLGGIFSSKASNTDKSLGATTDAIQGRDVIMFFKSFKSGKASFAFSNPKNLITSSSSSSILPALVIMS
jgi:hypothetical protein